MTVLKLHATCTVLNVYGSHSRASSCRISDVLVIFFYLFYYNIIQHLSFRRLRLSEKASFLFFFICEYGHSESLVVDRALSLSLSLSLLFSHW